MLLHAQQVMPTIGYISDVKLNEPLHYKENLLDDPRIMLN